MKKSALIQSLTTLIVSLFFSTFPMIVTAQNYYPAEIGNEWILDSTDGKERQTYTLEVPEDDADSHLILLKIVTENLNNDKVIDTDKYFLTDEPDGIKLHKTILEQQAIGTKGTATSIFSVPTVFFPKEFNLGKTWEIETDAILNLNGINLDLDTITEFEVVAFESVETSVGTFHNCVKIKLHLAVTAPLTTETTSYQWLAPNVGPVQFENNDGDVYEITSFKRSPPEIIAQNPPVWQSLPQNITGTGTRLGGILNALEMEQVSQQTYNENKTYGLLDGLETPQS